MEFHPGRKLGIVLGLAILASVFLLPFGTGSDTLYGMVSPLISDLGDIQASGDGAAIAYSYIFVIAFMLLVIGGLVGLFPLGTGVLGVVGMAMITVAGWLIYPNGSHPLSMGIGFLVIWALSIASLGASFWHREKKEKEKDTKVVVNVNVPESKPATPSQP